MTCEYIPNEPTDMYIPSRKIKHVAYDAQRYFRSLLIIRLYNKKRYRMRLKR